MRKNSIIFVLLVLLMAVLLFVDLSSGSIWLNLFGDMSEVQCQILWQLRAPKAITAILGGASLSVAGLMMQTLFRNPLAGPYILGVSSGASLGVAVVTLCATLLGASVALGSSIVVGAIVGSTVVLLIVMALAQRVHSNATLLIVGIMIGSVAGALVNLMQNFANPDALKLFIVWTLGSLSTVTWFQMPILLGVLLTGGIIAILLIKPLNGMLLGDDYARGLGVNVDRTRWLLVVSTGLLAGGITAFCGPIAFVGVAVPHFARGIFQTSDHRVTLPAAALVGADLLLICDILCSLFTYPLPISTVSALFGAPVILYIILKNTHHE